MAGNHRTEWTAQLHDVDDSSRVAGRFLRHDGTRFVGDANVASATSVAALDAAIDDLAVGLAAETSARQAADATLTTAVSGKQDHAATLDSLAVTNYAAGKLLGGQGTGIPAVVTVGSGLSLSGGTLATTGSSLAIGATVTGGTEGLVLHIGPGGVLAQAGVGAKVGLGGDPRVDAGLTVYGGLAIEPRDTTVGPMISLASSNGYGFDISEEAVSVGRLDFNRVFAGVKTIAFQYFRDIDKVLFAGRVGVGGDALSNVHMTVSGITETSRAIRTAGSLQVRGNDYLALTGTGSGVEVYYDPGAQQGGFVAYDRTLGVYRKIVGDALSHAWYVSGSPMLELSSSGSLVIGSGAVATTATNGFLYLPTCAGTPTGTPTAFTGRAPIQIDDSGSKLWAYVGGAWKSTPLT